MNESLRTALECALPCECRVKKTVKSLYKRGFKIYDLLVVWNFSWDIKMSREKTKTMPMQIFLGVKEVYYGIVQVKNNCPDVAIKSHQPPHSKGKWKIPHVKIPCCIKVAGNSFQYFSRLRVWWVIITTLYLLIPTSWYQQPVQSSENKLLLILWPSRLP